MTASSLRRFTTVATGMLCLTLASCKSTKKAGDYSGVVDYTTPDTNLSQEEYPFDEKGNYLADVVSGKRKGSKNKKIDPPKSYTDTYEKPPEPAVVAAPAPNYETPPTSNPYTPVYSSGSTASSGYQPATTSRATSNKAKSTAPSSSSKSKAKSKAVAKSKPKTKAKPKSSTVSYTIKKGDTLYSLANRYGTSVSAIKRASGLSSDTLRDGRNLKIPRK